MDEETRGEVREARVDGGDASKSARGAPGGRGDARCVHQGNRLSQETAARERRRTRAVDSDEQRFTRGTSKEIEPGRIVVASTSSERETESQKMRLKSAMRRAKESRRGSNGSTRVRHWGRET
ncbi:hypothetical protein BE221DRAFT_64231 [Ostreococcus tauri]|uniref:Uncharacterized protein n=1 Tax=Ostreococcus tauri TaxID=70448 RepID=A0A1Y5I3V1_OSTTA|nr:hypothetical protein BE221DRAFT_64231 [Ostreococcus tauri]